ncbi:hypothetical protein ASG22_18125 [Chryseobacterium sp. Leaf405]|uniref:hypothetical protein n=1 Tax=Chryseobacterium sp. Leaf405 TaxID=1736367 RepID=UPI0006F29F6E|nr:hypothetical protein [Chryseobacterium sp. Leaf405]KQT33137.1 hypothetical protein ASG22_18125 [Chryseobacterium sp. Leaf405]
MTKIIINRSSEFSNLLRSIEIYLGKTKIGELKHGESKEFEVQPGEHQLTAKIDWCRSNIIDFKIENDETLRYNLNGTSPLLGLYYITFGKNRYLKLKAIQ